MAVAVAVAVAESMVVEAAFRLPATAAKLLAKVVTAAFSQRRKVLRNTLGALRDVIDFEALGFDLGRRAEEVPVAEFVTVANALPADRIAGSLSDGPDLSED